MPKRKPSDLPFKEIKSVRTNKGSPRKYTDQDRWNSYQGINKKTDRTHSFMMFRFRQIESSQNTYWNCNHRGDSDHDKSPDNTVCDSTMRLLHGLRGIDQKVKA